MSNETKKFQWKPNLFDLAVVVIGVAVMAVIVLVLRPAAARVEKTQTMEFTVELLNMPEDSWKMIHVGDPIFDNAKKIQLGTVVSVEAEPYKISMAKADGSAIVESVMPGFESIKVVVSSEMTITSKEIQATGGYVVRVGNSIYLSGPNYAGNGNVIAMEREEDK